MGIYGGFVISAYAIAVISFTLLALTVLISNQRLKKTLKTLETEKEDLQQ